ncbi:MAG: phage integrase SAM-like domain-containing protein [Devosia sp.]|uniref:phage integrase SAM-like domain-containing protein n=1 Tax=Devosia sp. TaxID=1871048 RepID=UPI001ACE7862|nr:phage integrase SAM-like domain-containing protein [Devosia sp.]MBN9316585.1 phage integrase SAM-like domain-containing protein [Devosia sp.]
MAKRKLVPASQKPAASRSVVPIPATIESIKGYPEKLIIFQVPASPFWWTRYHDGKPIKRSTKATDKRDAITFAKQFYETLLVNKRLGISNNPRQTSFVIAAEEVIEDDLQKAQRGELSTSYVANHKTIIRGHIAAFLGTYELGDIDYAVLDKFKTYLFGKGLSAASVKLNFVYVKKILDHAQRKGVIRSSPLLPKIKAEDNARGYFALSEYALLRRTAHKLIGQRYELRQAAKDDGDGDAPSAKLKKLRNIDMTAEMALLIPFMVYSFIRPTDLKQIKHRHIEIRQGKDGKDYLWMPIPTSKKHDKPITSMPRAATFYKRLKANRLAQLDDPKTIDDEYVFVPQHPNRTYAYRQLARQFDVLMEATDLRESADGEARTLYSLRHTSLMYRLRYGAQISPLILANNARTSVEMLERFYLSQLESTHVTADLHAKKPTTPKRKAPVAVKRGRTVIVTPTEGAEVHMPHGPQSTSISSADTGLALNFDGIANGSAPDR